MPRSILFVTHSFPPASSPASIRILELANNFTELGWHVHILCPKDTYYPRSDPTLIDRVDPRVAVHKRWVWDLSQQQKAAREQHVVQQSSAGASAKPSSRSPISVAKRTLWQIGKQIRRRVMYPDVYVTWAPQLWWSIWQLHRQHKFDVIFATGDPWSVVTTSSRVATWLKVPFVADFRELWSAHSHRRDATVAQWFFKSEGALYGRTALVVANSPSEREILETLHPEVSQPTFIDIENGFNPYYFLKIAEDVTPALDDPFTITYTGSFRYRRPDSFLQALSELLAERPEINVHIHIAGPVEERVTNLVAALNLEKVVTFHGYLAYDDMIRLMYRSHILWAIVAIPDNRPEDPTVPAKMYEYAATGKPILLLSRSGGASRFWHNIEVAGAVVDNENVVEIKRVLEELWGQRDIMVTCCHLNVGNYSRAKLAAKLAVKIESTIL